MVGGGALEMQGQRLDQPGWRKIHDLMQQINQAIYDLAMGPNPDEQNPPTG
jgi:hypothetical protein